ncbi:Rpn family recombination-promoting nuclease/putative transposase [Lacrimispora sp.]|uniref:Rpn family recombination-promoting nuclease/putative transposase n=1 Tax=Lacrimispora sp. TaxID=2719234 RepID=UPI002FD8D7D6
MEYEHRNDILPENDELNLSDFALFLSVMKNRKAYECALSIIMNEQDLKLAEVKVEQVVLNRSGRRAIRMDAWAVGIDDRQFVTEMQNDTSSDDVRKRARFYQGLLDSPVLKAGKRTRYKYLPSSVIIFITQEDIFGKDLAKYTFTEQCKEIQGLELEDGTQKLFLNMKSKNGEPELISLLQYMKQSNLNNPDILVQDERIVKLDTIVNEVKQSEEWEAVNMSIYGRGIERGREEGMEKGIEEGKLRERKNMALEMLQNGEPLEKIMRYTKLTEEEIKVLKETCQTF